MFVVEQRVTFPDSLWEHVPRGNGGGLKKKEESNEEVQAVGLENIC